jgi:hypothetical protein
MNSMCGYSCNACVKYIDGYDGYIEILCNIIINNKQHYKSNKLNLQQNIIINNNNNNKNNRNNNINTNTNNNK